MTREHELLEKIAVDLDERADDIFGLIANGDADEFETDELAQAHRRAAEIIRYQVECEA